MVAFLAALLPNAGRAAEPFEISAILGLSGNISSAGRDERQVLLAVQDYVNRTGGIQGRPIKFNFLDSTGSPQVAVQLLSTLATNGVAAVVGPGASGECNAILPLLKSGPVSYCLSPGAHPDAGTFMFSTGFSTVDLVAVTVRYMREHGLKRIAVITTTDASGQDGDHNIDAAFADPVNKDLTIVAREHFAPADISVAAQVARIKAAAPQGVIAWTSGTSFGTFLRNAHDGGLDLPVFTTAANQTYEQIEAYATFLPPQLIICSGAFSAPEQITDRMQRVAVLALVDSLTRLNGRAGYPGQSAWDPAMLIVSAYRKFGVSASAAQIREYIASQRAWIGESGRYNFVDVPQRGLDTSSTIVVRWDAPKNRWIAVSRLGGALLK
jgi:branched-chain amino acid transport system substrate-binding protein